MKLCRSVLLRYRVIATVFGIAAMVGMVYGEKILISKPAVPIAVAPKEHEGLPELREKRLGFGGAPELEQPPMVRPALVRIAPREKEQDEDAGRHPWLRDPKNFPDAIGRARALNPLPSDKMPLSPRSRDTLGLRQPDTARALSPVTDFDWDVRDRNNPRNEPSSENRFSTSDKKEPRNRDMYSRRDPLEQNSEAGPSFFSDIFAVRIKEKSTTAQLEKRAAFEQLLNPNMTTVPRAPGSLEPVTVPDNPRPAIPLFLPGVGAAKIESGPSSMDPMTAFNQRQLRLRGPVLEDVNKKYQPAPGSAPSRGAVDPRFQTPLNRQPTRHDIPERRF